MKKIGFFLGFSLLILALTGCNSPVSPPEAPETYTLTYDGNGYVGSDVPSDDSSYAEGDIVSLSDGSLMSRAGYTFTGWNTQADGGGDHYAPGDDFTMPGQDTTLYAEWLLVSGGHTVTYDGNGYTSGTIPVDSAEYGAGDMVTLSDGGDLAKTGGYTFIGWNTQADGKGSPYDPSSSFTMPDNDVTMYARWQPGSDAEVPELISLNILTPNIDTGSADADVIIEVGAYDDYSLYKADLKLEAPSGTPVYQDIVLSFEAGYSGADYNGMFTMIITVPSGSESGDWSIQSITITDWSGKISSYSTTDLTNAGYSVTVHNN